MGVESDVAETGSEEVSIGGVGRGLGLEWGFT